MAEFTLSNNLSKRNRTEIKIGRNLKDWHSVLNLMFSDSNILQNRYLYSLHISSSVFNTILWITRKRTCYIYIWTISPNNTPNIAYNGEKCERTIHTHSTHYYFAVQKRIYWNEYNLEFLDWSSNPVVFLSDFYTRFVAILNW